MPNQKLSKKRIIVYIIIILAMIAGNVYIYRKNYTQDTIAIPDLAPGLAADANSSADIADRDSTSKSGALEYNLFSVLEKIGDWPIIPKEVGKADPFAPTFSR